MPFSEIRIRSWDIKSSYKWACYIFFKCHSSTHLVARNNCPQYLRVSYNLLCIFYSWICLDLWKNSLSWSLKNSGFPQFLPTLLSRIPFICNKTTSLKHKFFIFLFWLLAKTKEMREKMFLLSWCIIIFKMR